MIAKKIIGYSIIICTIVLLWFINSITQLNWHLSIIAFFEITVLFIVGIILGKKEYKYYDDYHPFVSVVVAAKDEENVIEDTIRSIEDSKYNDFEIIVIDDGSVDSEPEILDRLSKEFMNLKVIHVPKEERHGKAAALNRAFKIMKGEIVLILDADNRIPQEYIKDVVKLMKSSHIGAVQTAIRVYNERQGFIPLAYDTDQIVSNVLSSRSLFPPRSFGMGIFMKRNAIEKIFPLNEKTISEDQQITEGIDKAGYKIICFARNPVYELAPEHFHVMWNQRLRWFKGALMESLKGSVTGFSLYAFLILAVDFGLLDLVTGNISNLFGISCLSIIAILLYILIHFREEMKIDRIPQRFISLMCVYFINVLIWSYSLLISPALLNKPLEWYKTPKGGKRDVEGIHRDTSVQ
ncbi:MAG: glycosyltransferase family 2 protein [Thermotogae bacterium]|nr:glycosyltransferase family 2 protein [Thermotogota bacterium]